jgi:hypothetical protein
LEDYYKDVDFKKYMTVQQKYIWYEKKSWSLEEILEYLRSGSGYNSYLKDNGIAKGS